MTDTGWTAPEPWVTDPHAGDDAANRLIYKRKRLEVVLRFCEDTPSRLRQGFAGQARHLSAEPRIQSKGRRKVPIRTSAKLEWGCPVPEGAWDSSFCLAEIAAPLVGNVAKFGLVV